MAAALVSFIKKRVLGWDTDYDATAPRASPHPTTRNRAPSPTSHPVLSDPAPGDGVAAWAGQGVPPPAFVDSDGDEADGFFGVDGRPRPPAAPRRGK